MKKLVSILLTVAMIFAMTITAFAEEDTTNLTITGENRTYSAYKLLDVTASLKRDHVPHEGTQCTDACYTYSYSVREDSQCFSVLQGIVNSDDPNSVKIEDVLEYLDTNKADIQSIADRIYRGIVAAGLPVDETITTNSAELEQGYWLFADTTGLTGNKVNSVVIVNTKGLDNLTISPKGTAPTLEKKVLEVNDTTGANTEWADSADYDIGDNVSFKLTATLPDKYDSYGTYQLSFLDNLADGFELVTTSIAVTVYTDNTKQHTITVTKDRDYTIDIPSNEYDFKVTFANLKNITGITAESVFEVTYQAELTDGATIGGEGNNNEVTLQFSNNPYNGNTTGTISDVVTVYTYALVINKVTPVNGNNEPLAGAEFILSKKASDGSYAPVADAVLSPNGTTFTWEGLDAGEYKLEESVAPNGYNKMEDITFAITATHTEYDITSLECTLESPEIDEDEGTITQDIVNNIGTVLPSTGAMGTMWLILGGTMLVILAGVFMITRKKMSIYED